jgi:CheY-like chemotaxis protein
MIDQVVENPVEILLVEDNPGDIRLIEEGFKDGRFKKKLHIVRDGVEAMAFLRREGEYYNAVRPDLVLLDLNLPKKDGREVLAEIKADEDLKRTPVIILSTSSSEDDVLLSYKLHANMYITKPVGLRKFIEMIRAFESLWLMVVKLPPNGSE